ncbi:DUF3817 domain-containing protein [Kribbella italica]|uniref:DUF3817 domain-containing protein n=1 Tax=Kribbella italica TaxID=1540520 RepID=A0A7W9J8Y3_9ACTN|nr:DUF3817 domain-containing protein [Kribbella italica]MBB5837787.1 hypothetical protein [Kribbella italica]
MNPLRAAATAEVVSLVILFTNVFTVHWPAVSSLIGPIHGCCYLLVVILTARTVQAATNTKLLALIPAIGGLLVLRRLNTVASSN